MSLFPCRICISEICLRAHLVFLHGCNCKSIKSVKSALAIAQFQILPKKRSVKLNEIVLCKSRSILEAFEYLLNQNTRSCLISPGYNNSMRTLRNNTFEVNPLVCLPTTDAQRQQREITIPRHCNYSKWPAVVSVIQQYIYCKLPDLTSTILGNDILHVV